MLVLSYIIGLVLSSTAAFIGVTLCHRSSSALFVGLGIVIFIVGAIEIAIFIGAIVLFVLGVSK